MKRNNRVAFSRHAFSRVQDRLSLNSDQVAQMLLSEDKSAWVGHQVTDGRHRDLRLFWSTVDKQFFVAVEASDGTVVTIMSISWLRRIHIDPQVMASLMRSAGDLPKADVKEKKALFINGRIHEKLCAPLKPLNYIFLFRFALVGTWRMLRTARMRIPIAEYPEYVTKVKDFETCETVVQRLRDFAKMNTMENECLSDVHVMVGNNGKPEQLLIDFGGM